MAIKVQKTDYLSELSKSKDHNPAQNHQTGTQFEPDRQTDRQTDRQCKPKVL